MLATSYAKGRSQWTTKEMKVYYSVSGAILDMAFSIMHVVPTLRRTLRYAK